MKFVISREQILRGLQFVTGVVERRQSLPILANVLLRLKNTELSIIGTDLEIELTGRVNVLQVEQEGEITLPGRKLVDICRTLPENAQIVFHLQEDRMLVIAGYSRFNLATLPVHDFPLTSMDFQGNHFQVNQQDFAGLLESTHIAMAQQDVRFYLNGLFFEVTNDYFRAVATDGHRLALRSLRFVLSPGTAQFIVPRKGIMELLRLLNKENTEMVNISFGANAIKVETAAFAFVSRLIDGRFPDYHRVLPKNGDKIVLMDRDLLRQSLLRVAVLSNEKYRAVRLHLQPGSLAISATNMAQELAQDELPVNYQGTALEIGFNVNYLIDALTALPAGPVKMTFINAESSALIQSDKLADTLYVIMPLCL